MRILVGEDDPVTRRLILGSLTSWGYEVVCAENGREAWEHLKRADGPRLALLDWVMPELTGPEVCRALREGDVEGYVYVILLTGRDRQEDMLAGLGSGADDYLVKPFDVLELRARLRTGRRLMRLQEELLEAQETLRVQAMHDALTGVLNRGAIFDALEREIDRARRTGSSLGVALLDLDHFKQVNDTHGHPAGDAVLCEASRRIRSVLRPYDSVGRYGGEEFLLVLPGCSEAEAREIAERVRQRLAATPIETSAGLVAVTASLGVFAASWRRGMDDEALLAAVDAALYRAKHEGRDRVACARGLPLREDTEERASS